MLTEMINFEMPLLDATSIVFHAISPISSLGIGAAIQPLVAWIEQTSLSTALRNSDWAVMGLESIHLLGLALLGGTATLLGLAALRRQGLDDLSLPVLARALLPLLLAGLAIMAVSGILMVWGMPFKYYLNTAFRWKMLFLIGALLTTAWLSRSARKTDKPAMSLRAEAALSFFLWLFVGLSGRWIGFL